MSDGRALDEGLSQTEAALGSLALLASIWLAATGRLVGGRLRHRPERLLRAGAIACLAVTSLAQAATHWVDRRPELAGVSVPAAIVALALGTASLRVRARSR